MFARLFKTRIEKFYLFFDAWFSLFKFKRGDTEYGIGWIPLGGYVKISGMIDESMDKEQMKQPPQPYEFRSKKSWQRLLIMTGGVLFNLLLAMVIYIGVLFIWGETYLETKEVKYGIVTDSLGLEIGLRDGDKILTVDNEYFPNFYQIVYDIVLNERSSIQVERNGEVVNIPVKKEYIPLLLKGKGTIDARVPFGTFLITGFGKDSPSEAAGMAVGDQVTGIDGKKFDYYDEYQRYLLSKKGEQVDVSILRNGEELFLPVTITMTGMLGVTRNVEQVFEFAEFRYGFFESIPLGIKKGFKTVGDYLKQFRLIFSRDTKGYESLGGFLSIGSIFPAIWDWHAFWNLTAFLSIILAVMNILPIPALDGGHVMFLLYEVVSGRKPSDKFMEYAQITGMIIILALLIYANGNDILRFIIRK
ncbi:MAG: RIP metalloprotease RseP, partial [Bacteroidales bacterium]|nr:RIP metalloprotease RseP [Bacteroidales bacterium]